MAWADVVDENFMPGTAESLGIGYADAQRVNPNVVYLSASLFGRGGPHSGLRGLGGHLTHVAGLTAMTGPVGGPPVGPYGPYTDYLAPRFGVAAVLAALDYRRRTGKGQHLDLSQLETSVLCIAPTVLATAMTGEVPGLRGNKHEWAAPHDFFPCLGDDRWCAIAVFSDAEWSALRRVMADPDWAASRQFATAEGRKQHESELDERIGAWTRTQEAHELMERLQAAGVAAGVVQTVEDLFADPQLAARGHFQRLPHAEMGEHANDADCFSLSVTPARYRTAAPMLGEHTEQVLREILGMDDDEIVELLQSGVLE
jgi:benzylsuccinate CoA-transferase BbsF subunit